MKKIILGFALAAIVMAVAASFFGCSVRVEQPAQTTEAETAVTEPIQISEVTTVIKEVISGFVSEKHSEADEQETVISNVITTKKAAKPVTTKKAATVPSATELLTEAKKEETTVASGSYVITPTEQDFEDLEELLFDIATEYDCTDEDALDTAYRIAIGHMGGMYRNYYSLQDVEHISGVRDPGKVFLYDRTKDGGYEYEKYPADKVDFILRNILNVEPDHAYRVSGELYTSDGIKEAVWLYYHDGYYYVDFSPAGSTVSDMEIISTKTRNDGVYMIDMNTIENGEVLYCTRIFAELKNVNGEKVWSIYELFWANTMNG